MVNRLWAEHFGRGLVSTPANFGKLGDKPSHPQLLDWLATEFVGSGWSLKRMHRLMVTSQAYRQSSSASRGRSRTGPGQQACLAHDHETHDGRDALRFHPPRHWKARPEALRSPSRGRSPRKWRGDCQGFTGRMASCDLYPATPVYPGNPDGCLRSPAAQPELHGARAVNCRDAGATTYERG